MRKENVPQDEGVQGHYKRVSYAVDDDGRTVPVESKGFEPVNVANRMAWERLKVELGRIRGEIKAAEASPLAYYAALKQMDVGLLAQYTGFCRWRVRRHMKAQPFVKLKEDVLERYADVFEIGIEELRAVPETDEDPCLADTI
jgi:hypothetical protein